jgi:hypothetical protein
LSRAAIQFFRRLRPVVMVCKRSGTAQQIGRTPTALQTISSRKRIADRRGKRARQPERYLRKLRPGSLKPPSAVDSPDHAAYPFRAL